MPAIKSVYMMTDLEGVAGVDAWDPRHTDYAEQAKGVYERAEMQRLLTGEVNAAAAELFEAGVEEILINDAHGAGRTILPEELISGVHLARGINRPSWLLGIAPRFDALVQVGMHAMGGTPNACLAHSMSKDTRYRVNDEAIGEMEMAALLAGHLDIPWIFTAGDAHACRESVRWVPDIATAAVKEGLAEQCAIHLSPVDARNLIREQIQEAIIRAERISPLTIDGPTTIDIERDDPWPATLKPGAERLDAFTLRYSGENFWTTFHHIFYNKADFPLPA